MSKQTRPFDNNITSFRNELVVRTLTDLTGLSSEEIQKSIFRFYTNYCIRFIEEGLTKVSEDFIAYRSERACWMHLVPKYAPTVKGLPAEKFPWPFKDSPETFQDGMIESAKYVQFTQQYPAVLEMKKAEATKLAEQVQPSQPKPAS